MKKTLLLSLAAVLLPAFAFAATGSITQEKTFSYTPIASVDLLFNKFDPASITNATNVTLTSITFSINITKENGSIQADNDSTGSGEISMLQTVTVMLQTDVYIPSKLYSLSASSTYTSPIGATTGDSTTSFTATESTDYVDSELFLPVSTGTSASISSALADAGDESYVGNGTYVVTVEATQSSTANGVSGVAVAYSPASVRGKVTVTYNYTYEQPTNIPEPSTWAMLVGGLGVLAFSHRLRRHAV